MDTKWENFRENIKLEKKTRIAILHELSEYFFKYDRHLDLCEATDVYISPRTHTGMRIRRHKFFCNAEYRNQFTVRWKLPSGTRTEIDKIRDGYADWFFYGFLNEDENDIIQFVLINFDIFRYVTDPKRKYYVQPEFIFDNVDGSSTLAAFGINQFCGNMFVWHKGLSDWAETIIKRNTFENYKIPSM